MSRATSPSSSRALTRILDSSSAEATMAVEKVGPQDPRFRQNLIEGKVYPDEYTYPGGPKMPEPKNFEQIQRRLAQRRHTLSLSPTDFQQFKQANASALTEDHVLNWVIPLIQGRIADGQCYYGKDPFDNLDDLTDGKLVPGNPDIYYGAAPEQLDRRIRDELGGQIIPSTEYGPILPNFFLAVKGPDGTAAVASRQACYHGALGARGMDALLSFAQVLPEDGNNAYTITCFYLHGLLNIYTSHVCEGEDEESDPEYFMTQLRSFALTDSLETFVQGVTAFQNARDWAREQRDEAMQSANGLYL